MLFCIVFSGFKGIAKAYIRVNAVESLSNKSFVKKDDGRHDRIKELKNKARLGDPESNFELGLLYYKGEEVPEDLFLASAYFEKAEKLGHQDSLKILKQVNEYWANSEALANNAEVSPTDLIIEQLRDSSKRLNLRFPQKIDSETIIEKTEVGPGAVITYFYTLINYPSDKVSPENLRNIVLPNLLEKVKNERSLLEALANGAAFRHCYMGNDGKAVLDIPITYSTYSNHSRNNMIAKKSSLTVGGNGCLPVKAPVLVGF